MHSNLIQDKHRQFSFIVLGDWGLEAGNPAKRNQSNVAKAMTSIHYKLHTSFVISVGDHFYDNGVLSSMDERFRSGFEDIYSSELGPWYLVLGNHDMRGSVLAQIEYSDISHRWHFPNNYFFRDFYTHSNGNNDQNMFRVIFLDTNSILCDHKQQLNELEKFECEEMWYSSSDANQNFIPREQQLQWLENVIMDADEMESIRFIFIVGHHPLWSQGPHAIPRVFNSHLQPILRMSDKIVAYFCGHNHVLEHYVWKVNEKHEIHEILSGSGARFPHELESLPVEDVVNDVQLGFQASIIGFVTVEIHSSVKSIVIKYIDQFAKQLHFTSIQYE